MRRGKRQFVLIATTFMLPLLLAAWLYLGGFGTLSSTNHGLLLEPILHLPDAEAEPDVIALGDQQWLLVYLHRDHCDAGCNDALHKQRQSRLMLGKDMPRLQRIFLHGEAGVDTVFVNEEHSGLKIIRDKGLGRLLESRKPAMVADGGFYLIDPLGNLVMYFPPGLEARELVDDLKHLLELSRIG